MKLPELVDDIMPTILAGLSAADGAQAACVCHEWWQAWDSVIACSGYLRVDHVRPVALRDMQTLGSTQLASGEMCLSGFAKQSLAQSSQRLWLLPSPLPTERLPGLTLRSGRVESMPCEPSTLPASREGNWMCWPRALASSGDHLFVAQCTRNAGSAYPALVKLALPDGRVVAQSAPENVAQCVSAAVVGPYVFATDLNTRVDPRVPGKTVRGVWRWDFGLKQRTPFAPDVIKTPCAVVGYDGHVCVFDATSGLLLLTPEGVLSRTLVSLADLRALPQNGGCRLFDGNLARIDNHDKVALATHGGLLYMVFTVEAQARPGLLARQRPNGNQILVLDREGKVRQQLFFAGESATTACATSLGLYVTHWQAHGAFGLTLVPAAAGFVTGESS